MLKPKLISLSMAGILAFILICPAAMAQGYSDSPGYSGITLGSGGHWFSLLGLNYLSIGEGEQVGFHAGAGYAYGLAASAGAVFRLSDNGGIYTTYHYLSLDKSLFGVNVGKDPASASLVSVTYGAIPKDKSEFMWDVGVGYLLDPSAVVAMLGLGVSF